MKELEKAVENTINYAKKYGQNLSSKQITLRLISDKIYTQKEIKKICKNNEENNREDWQKKEKLAQNLVKKHLSKINGILMVGITGSVAAESANKGDDIDLLIITRKDELWWQRLFLRIYIWINRIPHRRYNFPEKKDEFCFNLWLDEENLEIPSQKRNLKNALDLVMMKVIYEKEGIYQKFLEKNEWAQKYVATGYKKLKKKNRKNLNSKIKREKKVWMSWLNLFCFRTQYWYMKRKKERTCVTSGQAFFHKDSK